MSQLDDRVQVSKVNSSDIEGKLKSKEDLYGLLEEHCKHQSLHSIGQFFLPWIHNCPLRFMKDILYGNKLVGDYDVILQALKTHELKMINVPRFEELSIKWVYSMVLDNFPDLEHYFPHYEDEYLPPTRFFWTVLSTLKKEMVDEIVHDCHHWRVEGLTENPDEEKINIRDDILAAINTAPYRSSKLLHCSPRREEGQDHLLAQGQVQVGLKAQAKETSWSQCDEQHCENDGRSLLLQRK